MQRAATSSSSVFIKAFNALPVAAVVFFEGRAMKPMANDAARQLFGVQLGVLVKRSFLRARHGAKASAYPAKDLPWIVALTEGIGCRKNDLLFSKGLKADAMRLQAFAMPLREGRAIIGAVTVFEEYLSYN